MTAALKKIAAEDTTPPQTPAEDNVQTQNEPPVSSNEGDTQMQGTEQQTPTKRSFSFETTFTVPVPQDLPKRAPSAQDLPFKDWFTANLKAALEGKTPHIFIPDAYWVEEREADKKLVNASYGRSKVMDQWRKWKFVHEKGKNTNKVVAGHEGANITATYRTGKEPGFNEPGLSVWLLKVS